MLRRYLTTGFVILVLAAGGGWAWRALIPRAAKARVPVAEAARGEFVVSLLAEGTLQSDDSVVVRTGKAPGELTMIVPDGKVVRAGDVFCRIEARDLERRRTDAELAYKQAQEEIERSRDSAEERYENDRREVEQADKDMKVWEASVGVRTKQAEDQLEFDRAEAERLRLEYERAQRMAAKGYQAAAEADIAKATYEAQQFKVGQSAKDLELSRREIASERRQKQSVVSSAQRRAQISRSRIEERVSFAKRRAEMAAKELETVVAALAETTITAPASGTVALFSTFRGGERRSWREGDQVSSGTPLGSISPSENMSLRCRVKESNIAALRKGQKAEIEFDALAGHRFTGVVSSVGSVAREVWVWEDPTAEANERVFDLLVKVNKVRLGGLKPGLSGRARIIIRRLPNALSVPLDAVFERAGKSFVYVKRGDGFVRREVRTGERNDVAVIVRAGLALRENVAMSDPTRYPALIARKGA
jgi:RND family efflux transporter MFP subunit